MAHLDRVWAAPEGCKIVAGGRRPPEHDQFVVSTLKGCETLGFR